MAEMQSAAAKPVVVTDQTFRQEVLESPVPVLVDFWAPWCGPCRMIAPVLEELAPKYQGKLKIAKLNVDENPRTPSEYFIQAIPTLILFKDGRPVDKIVGALPKPALEKRIEAALSAPAAPAGAQAKPVVVTDQTFRKEVLESDIPVLVDFWAPWCGPCRMIAPILDELAAQYNGKLKVAKMNVDENSLIPTSYFIQAIPTLMVFKGGQVVDKIVGALPKPALEKRLEPFLK
jgi:thioredoxin 1